VLLLAACASPATATPVEQAPASTPRPAATTPAPAAPSTTSEPTQPPATLTPAPPVSFTLGVEPIASGFVEPVYVTSAGDERLFVVEQAGRILVVDDRTALEPPFLDISPLVNSRGNEQGLLGLAFHPDYASNGEFFVNYTRQPDGATIVARYRVSGNPNAADPNSAEILLTVDQPEANHNGGQIAFGPDGYLYIGMGDGGGAGDRHGTIGNAQDPNALLGKMLRMDVATGDVSIWAKGLRNPWRFSFDRATGDLYITDVGQGSYEEINFQPASSQGGENYGWRIMEGAHCFNPRQGCDQAGLVLPIAEYDHGSGCSVTGGYAYRGARYPWLSGVYLFADYCTGIVWSLARDARGEWIMAERLDVDFSVSSFGEDAPGELYLVGHDDGVIYRLTATSP
jgi:glucose/arabinose dehydrogenase